MNNRIRMFRATVLLLILAFLMAGVRTVADGNGSDAPAVVYSNSLSLDDLLISREVRDIPAAKAQSDDLADFLESIDIAGAEKDDDGRYFIAEGVPYTIQMNFREETNGWQFPNSGSLTYRFPDGFSPYPTTGTAIIEGDGGDVRLNYVISGDTLTVTIDEASPGYSSFITSENVEFEIHATGVISKDRIEFSTQVSGEFVIDSEREVSVKKTGTYDADLNKVKFTIQAYSKGNNSNVHIGDIISGTALAYDPGTLTVSSNLRDPVPYNQDTRTGETFGLTIPTMAHGETVTVEYYADINLNGLTGTGNGHYGTVEQTGNTARISSDEDGPGDEDTVSDEDFQNRIALSTNSKTASSQQVRDGKTYVTWTIVLNENANISIAGKSVTDIIELSSRQYMRYSGAGLHIEKYRKDGSSAGTSDVRWGANGLNVSEDGSGWTYTIPASDAGENYRYVITYETEVDSEAFLNTTVVGNTVENEYDTDWGAANVETTGEEVEAVKEEVQSVADKARKEAETEWKITFTVPAAGLDSAEIVDILPRFLDPDQNTWFYDVYREGSVRVEEGDLLQGEGFSVDATSQDHQVVISFTKNNGQSGLTGTGLTRTIHVYLTTVAGPAWLVYAESESRARTHLNNAVVRVNGQEISISGTARYNTSNYELEKRLEGTYSTSTEPALPIYVYRITLTNVNDDAFSDGYLTITDDYDSEYLVYETEYSTYDENNVNGPNGHVYGNTQWNKYGMYSQGPYVVDDSLSTEGQIVFKLRKEDLPKFGSSYYPYYAIFYALQVKDAETLDRMKNEALRAKGLKVDLVNTAVNDQLGTDTIVTEYSIKALEKTLEGDEDNSGTGTHDFHFKIEVNPEGLRIGEEDTITVKDTLTNLSFDYTSIEIEPQMDGDILNRAGNSIIFTLHNETPYTITYIARLIGLHDVQWNNKAEMYGYTSGVNGNSSTQSGGSGSYRTYSMNVMKYAEGNMNEGLAATFELYEARVKDADGDDIPNPVWQQVQVFTTDETTGINFTTDETTGIYKIVAVYREDMTGPQSLRPYSYHDENGIERFGPAGSQNYGWRYRVKEVEPPEGYQRTNVVYEFGISDIPSYSAPYCYLNADTVTIVNKPIGLPVETVIPGQKILVGKELESRAFTFSLSPEESVKTAWGEESYPGGFEGSLTAKNDADGRFSFPLTFTYDDYLTAVEKGYVDENQGACFYYVVKELLPEGAEDYFWNGIRYDDSRFLVAVKLFVNGSQLTTETSYYPYDETGIPNGA